ncbi:troponin T isoform X3 [Zerene cesonia]|uniref:troponin T isoform X3 n=1 Tax=Zerene cesonia TaxID=33412 RepID=UPI0018E59CE1|nr:troponin T isoform X3 [Zerene cesonia]
MSDEEEYSGSEEEEVEEEVVETPAPKQESRPSIAGEGDPEFIKRQDQKRSDLDEQLKEYINEWRKQRSKEEDELKRLKEKQAKRKVSRAEEEKRLAQKKKEEEERRIREIEEKKQRDIEEKRQRLEEAEKKRQAMLQAMKDASNKTGPNFTIQKRSDNQFGLSNAQLERNKTKEQLEEEKKISLSIRIKPLNIEGLSVDKLRQKATELWECIVKLETEKYDLEERQKRQDYDLKELKERQKQQLRHKALKKGLDPEALTGKHPPKIQVASKYERRVDTRSYDDKKKLFEGGYDTQVTEILDKLWKEKHEEFMNRTKTRLPKWFGERPGKKKGEPESPEGEEDVKAEPEDDEEPQFEPEPEEEEVVEEEEVEEEEEEEEEEQTKPARSYSRAAASTVLFHNQSIN